MNQLTRLAIHGYLEGHRGSHPSTVILIPFTLAEWEAILRDSPHEADQRHTARMEDDLLAIAETVQPKPGQDSMDYAMIVSGIRHIFEADEEFYINLAAKVRGRNAPLESK